MSAEKAAFDALCGYTLALRDAEFIHQHVVDAFAAQRAEAGTKPITLAFALVGLYLAVEKGRTGREVQQVHTRLARRRRDWPPFQIPQERGSIRVSAVVATPEGAERIEAIRAWCRTVWSAFARNREAVVQLLREYDLA